jgi:hypothetical protein
MNAEPKFVSLRSLSTSNDVDWNRDWRADGGSLMAATPDEQQSVKTPASLPCRAVPASAPLRRSLFRA